MEEGKNTCARLRWEARTDLGARLRKEVGAIRCSGIRAIRDCVRNGTGPGRVQMSQRKHEKITLFATARMDAGPLTYTSMMHHEECKVAEPWSQAVSKKGIKEIRTACKRTAQSEYVHGLIK